MRFERLETMADGREVMLRPIVPADVDELRRAVEEADPETLHSRFLGGRAPRSDDELSRLATVDYTSRFAVVAITDEGRGVGVARYERLADERCAEVAVAVDPHWRRVGLASSLLRLLGEAALDNGIERFSVEFVLTNVDVGSIIAESHLPVVIRQQDGIAMAELDLTASLGGVIAPWPPTSGRP